MNHDKNGRILPQFPDEQFIDAVNGLKMSSTGDIAAEVGCKSRNANIRLARLHAEGAISRVLVGGRWIWLPPT